MKRLPTYTATFSYLPLKVNDNSKEFSTAMNGLREMIHPIETVLSIISSAETETYLFCALQFQRFQTFHAKRHSGTDAKVFEALFEKAKELKLVPLFANALVYPNNIVNELRVNQQAGHK
jgi:hypothetical protein